GNGTYTAVLTSSTVPETAEITGTVNGELMDDQAQVQFVSTRVPSAENTLIEADPTTITADGTTTSTVTVTVFDQHNDPIGTGGDTITLATTAGTLSTVTDNNDGTYTATLTSSTTAETAVIT